MVCAVAPAFPRISARIRAVAGHDRRGGMVSRMATQSHGQDRADRREMTAPGEEDRDGHDGEEFPDRPGRQHVPAELAGEHVVVVQDGQQRAERGGGQREPDRHEVADEADSAEDRDRAYGMKAPKTSRRDRQAPAAPGAAAGQTRTRPAGTEPSPTSASSWMLPRIGQADRAGRSDTPPQENNDLGNARARQKRRRQGRAPPPGPRPPGLPDHGKRPLTKAAAQPGMALIIQHPPDQQGMLASTTLAAKVPVEQGTHRQSVSANMAQQPGTSAWARPSSTHRPGPGPGRGSWAGYLAPVTLSHWTLTAVTPGAGNDADPALSGNRPATGEVTETFPFATDAEVAEALAAATEAFAAWRLRPVAERAAVVKRIAELFTERAADLAALITKEMGKRPAQAVGEAEFCTDIFNYYADNGPGLIADKPLPGHDTARVEYRPVGPVLGVMPWNYPYYQVARFAAPNLIVGNTVILKHAENCPTSALAIAQIMKDAGVPDGVYVNLFATHEQVAAMIADPRLQRRVGDHRGDLLVGREEVDVHAVRHAGVLHDLSNRQSRGMGVFCVLEYDGVADDQVGRGEPGHLVIRGSSTASRRVPARRAGTPPARCHGRAATCRR